MRKVAVVVVGILCFLVLFTMVSRGNAGVPVPPPSGLVSWWPGDGNADDIWNGNDGTLMNGATFAPGMVSQAFSLDGVNDFINVPDGASLDITEALSIDMWMKAPPVTNDQGAEIVDKGDYAFVGGAYTLRISAIYPGDIPNAGPNLAGRVNFLIWIGEPSTYPHDTWHINSQSRVDDDAWHFIAATYDGAAMKLYVDGVLETTFSVSGNIRPTDLDLRLGCNSYTGGGCFRGLIDEVEIYNRALSAGEIQALYDAGDAGKIKTTTTVTSTPITGIPFTINTVSKTTPYTDLLPEGYYTLEMPQTYNGYEWSKWLEDGDTSRTKTNYLHGTTWTGVYVQTTPPVGGQWAPIDTVKLLSPWITLASLAMVALTSFVYIKHKKKQQN